MRKIVKKVNLRTSTARHMAAYTKLRFIATQPFIKLALIQFSQGFKALDCRPGTLSDFETACGNNQLFNWRVVGFNTIIKGFDLSLFYVLAKLAFFY